MNDQLSKLSIGLLGFVAGVAFLISCGGSGDGDTGISLPINDADAATPDSIWSDVIVSTDYTDSALNEYTVPVSGQILTDVISPLAYNVDSGYCYLKVNGQNFAILRAINGGVLKLRSGVRMNQGDVYSMLCWTGANTRYPSYTLAGIK